MNTSNNKKIQWITKNKWISGSSRAFQTTSNVALPKLPEICTLSFYTKLLAMEGILLEEAVNKQPIATIARRIPITSINTIERILMIPGREIQINFGTSNLVVFDFDFHKCANELEQDLIKAKVLELAKYYNITTVSSKSGGLHLYLDKTDRDFQQAVGITLTCLIPMVDICTHKIIGPNLSERKVVAYCGFFTKVPNIFSPLSNKDSKLVEASNPHRSFVQCWNKGYRRRTLLSLLAVRYLSNDAVKSINTLIFNPPKSEDELEDEVLSKIEGLHIKNEYDDCLYQNEVMKNIRFDMVTDTFFLWDKEGSCYKKITTPEVLALIKSLVSFENFEKFSKKYLLQLKEYNVFRKSKSEKTFEFTNSSFNIEEGKFNPVSEEQKKDRAPENILKYPVDTFSLNQSITEYHEDILEVVQAIAPNIYTFIMSKFSNFKRKTQMDFTRLILDVCFLVFLKNSESFKDFCPKKILWFYGPGGTGKSQLIDFISSFLNSEKVGASDFSVITKNFETGAWLDKKLILFNDEALSSNKSSLDSHVSSMIKKITGGDLIRVEKKYAMAETQRLNLFLFCSMNYQVNSGDTTNYVAMNRRAIRIPLLNFVQAKDRVDNFNETLPDGEKAKLIEYFLKNLDSFPKVFKRFNLCNIDHILLRNKEAEYYYLMDPIFAFLSLKCTFETNKKVVTFYEFYARYIRYHFIEFDTLITVKDYNLFLMKIKDVIKNPFNMDKFNDLTTTVSSISTNLDKLDPLLHLPFLSQNTFTSFFAIIESRLPFLLEEIDLNSVKLVPAFGDYTDSKTNKSVNLRLIGIKGINFPTDSAEDCSTGVTVDEVDDIDEVAHFSIIHDSTDSDDCSTGVTVEKVVIVEKIVIIEKVDVIDEVDPVSIIHNSTDSDDCSTGVTVEKVVIVEKIVIIEKVDVIDEVDPVSIIHDSTDGEDCSTVTPVEWWPDWIRPKGYIPLLGSCLHECTVTQPEKIRFYSQFSWTDQEGILHGGEYKGELLNWFRNSEVSINLFPNSSSDDSETTNIDIVDLLMTYTYLKVTKKPP